MNLLPYLLARVKEPSSAAGIGLFLAALGVHLPQPALNAAVQLFSTLLALLAVVLPEKGNSPHA